MAPAQVTTKADGCINKYDRIAVRELGAGSETQINEIAVFVEYDVGKGYCIRAICRDSRSGKMYGEGADPAHRPVVFRLDYPPHFQGKTLVGYCELKAINLIIRRMVNKLAERANLKLVRPVRSFYL